MGVPTAAGDEKRHEGRVKLTIGASLLGALGLVLVVSALVGGTEDTGIRQDTTPEVASSDADITLDGANRYLRGIDQVRVTGTVVGGRFDVTFVGHEDAVGTLTSGDVILRFIHVGDDTYINPSDTLWKSSPDPRAITDLVDGRWIRVDTHDEPFKKLASLSDRELFIKPLSGLRDYTSGRPKTIRGVECIAVKFSFGGIIYLAHDPARMMRVEDGNGFVAELDYDAPEVTAKAPTAVIDGSEVFPPNPKT